MKGFLNKVQRRVTSTNPSNIDGSKSDAKPQPAVSSSPTLNVGMKPNPNAQGRVGGVVVESTPRADVMLPRRERR